MKFIKAVKRKRTCEECGDPIPPEEFRYSHNGTRIHGKCLKRLGVAIERANANVKKLEGM